MAEPIAGWRRRAGPWGLLIAALVVVLTGCSRPDAGTASGESTPAGPAETTCPVVVRKPDGPPMIATGVVDEKGNPVKVACATCHTTKPSRSEALVGTPLKQFHQSLPGKHGNLACVACHNPDDGYASLRLADGRSLPYSEVMTLCAQCHGPQFRDYEHGAHGGMTGYWDLSKGGRVRNNCIDCHNPHAPKYPTVTPAPGPNDRFPPGGRHE